jgi:hypothetical protein
LNNKEVAMKQLLVVFLLLGLFCWVQAQEISFTADFTRMFVEPGTVGTFPCDLGNLWNDSNHVAVRLDPHYPAEWNVHMCTKYGCLPPGILYVDYTLNPLEVDTAFTVDIHSSSTPDSGWVTATAMSLEDTNLYRVSLTFTLITYANGIIIKMEPGIPERFIVAQNYPNPFNPSTTISISIPDYLIGQNATLTVYDILGREVQRLFQGTVTSGILITAWDSRNTANREVASGTYFYRFTTGQVQSVHSMQLVR